MEICVVVNHCVNTAAVEDVTALPSMLRSEHLPYNVAEAFDD